MSGRQANSWWLIPILLVVFTLHGAVGGAIGGSTVLRSELYAALMNPWQPNEWNRRELFAMGVAGGVVMGYLLMLITYYYRRQRLVMMLFLLAGFPICIVAGGGPVIALSILMHAA